MTQTQLFLTLLITVVMWITGTKEMMTGNRWLGAFMVMVPVCGWASVVLGR